MLTQELIVNPPQVDDGASMWRLARQVGLDPNSPYKYLLFCRDFAETSVVARRSDEVVGFLTGYRRPEAPDTLFVWQVGVLPSQRGRGVAGAMLEHVTSSEPLGDVDDPLSEAGEAADLRYLEATVTPGNEGSLRLFTGFGERRGAAVEKRVLFGDEDFPVDHEEEILLRVGPL